MAACLCGTRVRRFRTESTLAAAARLLMGPLADPLAELAEFPTVCARSTGALSCSMPWFPRRSPAPTSSELTEAGAVDCPLLWMCCQLLGRTRARCGAHGRLSSPYMSMEIARRINEWQPKEEHRRHGWGGRRKGRVEWFIRTCGWVGKPGEVGISLRF